MKTFRSIALALPALLATLFLTTGCDADKDKGPRGELVVALEDPPCATLGVAVFVDGNQYGPIRPGDEISINLRPGSYVVEVTSLEGETYVPGRAQIVQGETTFIPLQCR